jgi:DNA-binding protein Fis
VSSSNGAESNAQRIRRALHGAGLTNVTLQELESAAIFMAMTAANGDRARAAGMLGISLESLGQKLGAPD